MEKAFFYLRVSSPGQVEGTGLDRQEEVCGPTLRKPGLRLKESSGKKVYPGLRMRPQRPPFRVDGAILSNGVKTVIVESLGSA